MFKSISSSYVYGLVGLLVVGCGNSGSAPSPSASSSAHPVESAKPSAMVAAKPPEPMKSAEPAAAPAEMVEYDLSSADPKWKGWVAKGPAGAQVMADGVNGARIAGKGPNILDHKAGGENGFDMAFAWGKDDLKTLKANLQKGADHPMGDVKTKLTFTKEEPDLLEWTTEVLNGKSYNFVMHMKVEKTDITCKNNYMVGSGNEAEHKSVMDACKTLAKKAK